MNELLASIFYRKKLLCQAPLRAPRASLSLTIDFHLQREESALEDGRLILAWFHRWLRRRCERHIPREEVAGERQ